MLKLLAVSRTKSFDLPSTRIAGFAAAPFRSRSIGARSPLKSGVYQNFGQYPGAESAHLFRLVERMCNTLGWNEAGNPTFWSRAGNRGSDRSGSNTGETPRNVTNGSWISQARCRRSNAFSYS